MKKQVDIDIDTAPDILTAEEVAVLMRASRNQIYAMAKDDKIPNVKLGRLVRFPKRRLLEWIESGGCAYLNQRNRSRRLFP